MLGKIKITNPKLCKSCWDPKPKRSSKISQKAFLYCPPCAKKHKKLMAQAWYKRRRKFLKRQALDYYYKNKEKILAQRKQDYLAFREAKIKRSQERYQQGMKDYRAKLISQL